MALRELGRRLWFLVSRRRRVDDLTDEMRLHIDLRAAKLRADGQTAPEHAARRRFGNVTRLLEESRRVWGWSGSEWLDVKLGLRLLRKSWGLTLVGGLAITVTIGLGASIFTVWNTISSTDLPLEDGDRVVALQPWDTAAQLARPVRLADFERWRDGLGSVVDLGTFRQMDRVLVVPSGPTVSVRTAAMTASGFTVARVQPVLGRPLLPEDERPGAPPVVVIGQEIWQSAFSNDPQVLGQEVELGGVLHTVVGVMPQGFGFPVNQRAWTALRVGTPRPDPGEGDQAAFVFGRLAPGASLEAAGAALSALGFVPPETPGGNDRLQPRVVPYAEGVLPGLHATRWADQLILALGALLLIPPCANIAILVYARTVAREDEFAARHALGAGRSRIVRQVFIEVLVMSALAAGLGLALAHRFAWQISSIVLIAGANQDSAPFWMDFSLSLKTVLFVTALALFAALIAGGIPAIRATGQWKRSGLHALGSRAPTLRLGTTWTLLVAAQVALALALLPLGAQIAWGEIRPSLRDDGRWLEPLAIAQLTVDRATVRTPSPDSPARFGTLRTELVRQLELAQDATATVSTASPFGQPEAAIEIERQSRGVNAGEITFNAVDGAFFDVFGMRLLAGRRFEAGTFEPGSNAVVVNREFVERKLDGASPLGLRLRYVDSERPPPEWADGWYEVVGLVEDFLEDRSTPTVYHPMGATIGPPLVLGLRYRSAVPEDLAGRLLEVVTGLSTLRVTSVSPLASVYRQFESGAHPFVFVLASIMLIVLLFSMTGIYTLMAFTLAQHRQEIGIRAALGAQPGRLVTGIFGRALTPVAIGVVFGSLLAFLADSYLPLDEIGLPVPGVLPGSAFLMACAAMLAVSGPARRALRLDPADVLRRGD